ncbi:MAG: prepilin-type N-terminal cleavage/methylation domain-containing protein [Gammaproteobacteria bacterium]|nr:prepilin-type N-terminal cleavage/methylation domain-containing protein [Gammaproteobacteria bacterium]
MRQVWGFTLIELMITVLVLSLLLGVAVPSMMSMIENNSVVAESNELVASLLLARSEAVKTERDTHFSITGDGWTSFVDLDDDGTEDVNDGESLVNHTVNNINITVTANGAAASVIRFGSDGRAIWGGGGFTDSATDFFRLQRGDAPTRCIRFSLSGRPWVDKDISEGGTCP